MKNKQISTLFCLLLMPMTAFCTLAPTAVYVDSSGAENTANADDEIKGEAPLHVLFYANASDLNAGSSIEWHFRHTGADGTDHYTRYGDNVEFDFTQSGKTVVTVYERLDDELVDSASITVTISDSHLEMPNAFSPNGDGTNDYYQAKSNYKSIVEFHAYIFNRWGQKLYEWTDCTDEKKGWDGTFHGSPCKDGVYYVLVKARGADGRVYEIKRDVNLMRKFNEVTNGGGSN